MSTITPAQIRAGRALVGLTQRDLGERAGVPTDTVCRIEGERRPPRRQTIDALRAALESAGVRWTDAGGVEPADAA